MRSPERRYQFLWFSCLLTALVTWPVWAQVSGQITGVKLEADKKRIVIESKGKIGEHVARVMARPNRLTVDFKDTGLGRLPSKISVADDAIKQIRVGSNESRARLVVDFQDKPVPPFQVKREENRVLLVFGQGLSDQAPAASRHESEAGSTEVASPKPLAAPPNARTPQPLAAVNPTVGNSPGAAAKLPWQAKNAGDAKADESTKGTNGWTVGTWDGKAANSPRAVASPTRDRMAQSLEINQPPSTLRRQRPASEVQADSAPAGDDNGKKYASSIPSHQGTPDQRQMVREVRPPVTPPTPDPRLLVQEITELQFIQVGHNSRLVVRGGDHLDYRLNNVSPTKVRLDLVNAEIPKVHQKPLKTDLFSTSVEMIIPGSQTIFIQLKDAVPLQVEKKKGVLMLDFPPPRFVITPDTQKGAGQVSKPGEGDQAAREMFKRGREERKQALEAIREQEILKSNEMRRKAIESLQKQQEELEKQRTEILKRYRVTPDPQVFQKPVSMDFQGISLKNAFRLLAEQAGMNIIVDDKVSGTTTLRLFQVPLGQVIDTILNSHGLDREMVGNVMRVGQMKDIEDLKKARYAEYKTRIDEVNKRLGEIADEIKKKHEESQDALKALEKTTTEVDEPKEDVKSEEIGEAGCIKVGNKDICFYFTQVKLIYALPKPIVDTLRCMFNLQCAGMETGPGAAAAAAARDEEKAKTDKAAYDKQLSDQGFAPGSPGYQQNMAAFERRQSTQGMASASKDLARAAQGLAEAAKGGPAAGEKAGPVGPDAELQQIIANSMIWPDEPNKMVFIKDTSDRIAQMKKLIYSLDKPDPQVVIEGRLVQATQSWGRALGIMWGGRNNAAGYLGAMPKPGDPTGYQNELRTGYVGVTGLQGGGDANTATGQTTWGDNIPSSFAVNLPAALTGGTVLGLGFQFGLWLNQTLTELDTRISLGETTGQAKTISRPKVTVVNKQKANIKKGTTVPYASVGISGTQVQFINADLGLDVTPEIFPDGRIRMNVKISNNAPDWTRNIVGVGPPINTREANTVMTVKDGETAVIGGILEDTKGQSRNGWPGLMNVPVINFLFSNKNTTRSLEELLVFIAPVIVKRPPPAS